MDNRFLNAALARLRFAAANRQPWPLAALALVTAAVGGHVFVLPAREAAIDDAARRLASLDKEMRRAAIARQVRESSPTEARQRLLDRFPTEVQLNATLGRMLDKAKGAGLQVPSGDYRLQLDKKGPIDRYVLTLPVKGSYLNIRRYVAAVCAEFPDLAVEDIGLRRENIGATEVEAQLRFMLFGRRAAL